MLLAAGFLYSLMQTLMQTLVLPAPPALGVSLDSSPETTAWALTAFLLSAAVSTPLVGELGDPPRPGGVLVALAAGSAVCAMADGPDLGAAKNLTSLAAWRAADRAMALFGGEGYETAASNRARGATPRPVERCFRDARALRVAGGVDSMMDRWSAEANLTACYYAGRRRDDVHAPTVGAAPSAARRAEVEGARSPAGRGLPGVDAVPVRRAVRPAAHGRHVGRIASEILGMVIVTARAAGSGARRDDEHLAEAACASTGRRLAGLWAELDAELAAPPGRDWLAGSAVDLLACPVDIDTDALIKTVRADSHGAVSERAATALARHWGAAQEAARTALAVGGRRRQLLHRWAWCARSCSARTARGGVREREQPVDHRRSCAGLDRPLPAPRP